jgi:hypothetical protein
LSFRDITASSIKTYHSLHSNHPPASKASLSSRAITAASTASKAHPPFFRIFQPALKNPIAYYIVAKFYAGERANVNEKRKQKHKIQGFYSHVSQLVFFGPTSWKSI